VKKATVFVEFILSYKKQALLLVPTDVYTHMKCQSQEGVKKLVETIVRQFEEQTGKKTVKVIPKCGLEVLPTSDSLISVIFPAKAVGHVNPKNEIPKIRLVLKSLEAHT
jgi:hypothetical protein